MHIWYQKPSQAVSESPAWPGLEPLGRAGTLSTRVAMSYSGFANSDSTIDNFSPSAKTQKVVVSIM